MQVGPFLKIGGNFVRAFDWRAVLTKNGGLMLAHGSRYVKRIKPDTVLAFVVRVATRRLG